MDSLLAPLTQLRRGKTRVSVAEALGEKKIIGFYFSAHWCSPCRSFTPRLIHFYNQTKEACENDFEVVFVSADSGSSSSASNFEAYFGGMPWLAVPFTDGDTADALQARFNVTGIPALVLVNRDGTFIEENGRDLVLGKPRHFPWGIPAPTDAVAKIPSIPDAAMGYGYYDDGSSTN